MTQLEQAIANAQTEIVANSREKLTMTNYFIRRNIELVQENPKKFEKQFIAMYIK